MFAKSSYEFPCVNGTLKFLNSPRTSSKAAGKFEPEGDDDVEEGDRKEVSQIQRQYFTDIMINFEPSCTTQTNKHSPIPLKFVGVMRGTKKVLDNVSDKAINGAWTKAKDVRLLEVWAEMTRVQILCTGLPAKLHIGKCKSHEDLENDRTPQHLVEISTQLSNKPRGMTRCRRGKRS